MAKKNNTVLILGIAAVGFYLWKRNQAQGQPVALMPGSGLNPTLPTSPVSSPSFIQPVTQAAPVSQVQNVQPSPVSSGVTIPADVYTWIGTLDLANQGQANKALTLMSQSEVNSLEDIVHNDFYGNGITTTAQRQFWDAWRVKYHVLDGTYS
jgi:hypothetical protein